MKKLFTSILFLSFVAYLSGQTSIYLEDFEGASPSVSSYTASGGTASWAVNSSYSVSGTKSDSGLVVTSDTLFLETSSINASTASFLTLKFKQICKISFFDKGIIQVSDDNGSSWTTLTSSEYNGTGFLNANGFSAISYATWDAGNNGTTPTNSWWKSESFDLTNIAANSAQLKVRFALIDADNNGPVGTYGWLVDDIEILAASCELVPPSITLSGTIYQGIVYSTGPYNIQADIQDASGISSATINYTINGVPAASSINMSLQSGSTYVGSIPSASIGDTICYTITAVDATSCANSATFPNSTCIEFEVKSNPPPACAGTPVSIFNYNESFATFTPGTGRPAGGLGTFTNDWVNESTSDTHDWWVYNQSTVSGQTGPSQDHSGADANYVYVEASTSFNEIAILNTPCFDFTNLLAPKFRFWYHMYGVNMGELHLDAYFGGQWVLDIMPALSGDKGDVWLFKEVDLTAYAGNIVKLRFRAVVGSGYRSDIAIDDVEIFEPLANELELSKMVSPNPAGCSGSASEYVTVQITNNGGMAQNLIPVAYRLNGGSIIRDTAKFNIPTGTIANFTFQQSVNMTAPGSYNFDAWIELGSDLDKLNDSIFNFAVSSSAITSNFPDTSNFESFVVGVPGTFQDGWINSQGDQHDWYVNSGSTPSQAGTGLTGPTGDTSEVNGTGKYVYIEATNLNNLEAILNSKCYDISQLNQPELTFYYHMYGAQMGELHLDVSVSGFEIQDIITPITGDQGTSWKKIVLDLSPFKGVIKLVFRGMTGNGYQSDIAIDNVIIRDAMPIGLIEERSINEISIYPNPTNLDHVTVLSSKEINRIDLIDITGKEVLSIGNINKSNTILDVSSQSSGIYFVKIYSAEEVKIQKLVIK